MIKRIKLSELKSVLKEIIKEEQEVYDELDPIASAKTSAKYNRDIEAEAIEYAGSENWSKLSEKEKEEVYAFLDDSFDRRFSESKVIKENLDPTFKSLINAAIRDGHLTGHEASAGYVLAAAKEISDEFDKLTPDEKEAHGPAYYRNFLEKIGKK